MSRSPTPRNGRQFRAFLSGAIEHAPDGGVAWRRAIASHLDGLGHTYYDATTAQDEVLDPEETENFFAWKRGDLDRFRRTMRKIIAHDLDELVDRADYVIAYWDEHTLHGGGTHGEITLAHHRGIPVYLLTSLPPERISGWILGCTEAVFRDAASLVAFLASAYGGQ